MRQSLAENGELACLWHGQVGRWKSHTVSHGGAMTVEPAVAEAMARQAGKPAGGVSVCAGAGAGRQASGRGTVAAVTVADAAPERRRAAQFHKQLLAKGLKSRLLARTGNYARRIAAMVNSHCH